MADPGTALYVTTSDPRSPLRGSEQRAHQVVEWLRDSGYRVIVLLFLRSEVADKPAVTQTEQQFYEFRSATCPDDSDYWHPADLGDAISQVARNTNPAVVMVRYSYLLRCLSDVERRPGRIFAVDADNLYGDRRSLFESRGVPYSFFSCDVHEEAQDLSTADVVVCVSHAEAAIVRQYVGSSVRVLTLEFVVHADRVRTADSSTILYVGSAFSANTASLRWFLDNVWPRLIDHPSGPTLKVVGEVGATFEASRGVHFAGESQSVDPFYEICGLVINPSLVGTGVSTKSADAIYRGKCLVSTQEGMAGLARFKKAAVVTTSSDEMALRLHALLSYPQRIRVVEDVTWRLARASKLQILNSRPSLHSSAGEDETLTQS